MRGKADVVQQAVSCIGITPAYAGKSWKESGCINPIRDHPRLCGEKFMRLFPCLTPLGSPPPMRGKVPSVRSKAFSSGITPAYAGKRGFGLFPNLCI